jgi:hypothetical protein
MSLTTPSQPAPSPVANDTERTVLISVGGVLSGLGALVAIAGIALLAVFGTDGALSSGRHTVSTPTTGLATGATRVVNTTEVAQVLGKSSIQVSADAAGGRAVFVGVGRTADVDRYLAGAAREEITDFDVSPFRLSRDTRPGGTPAPPVSQPFWVASSSGSHTAIDWKVRDGSYKVVVMNADGSRHLTTRAQVAITVEHLPDIAWTMIGAGFLVLLGGAAMLVGGLRRRA